MIDSFFVHTFCSPAFDFNIGGDINESRSYTLTSAILKFDVVWDVAMTSTPNVLTTQLRDLLYNQCIDNTCCYSFLAHLSRRLICWTYRIGRPPSSVVRPSVRPSVVCRLHSLNIFSSETTGSVKVKFHMELLWDGGTKICSNGPGHMTKMAAMPIYMDSKNHKKSSSPEPKVRWPWNLVCSIGCSNTTKFVQILTLGWPRPILRQGQIWSLMLLYGKRVKQRIFQKLLSSMIWN